ncbi:MAG: FeoA domain-containing protein [Propionibacteriaceae bacterium]|jgi:ferrous iron transport protein A|nr:FeoA domain-containing protein [Propionibacteriaceae bacterium]
MHDSLAVAARLLTLAEAPLRTSLTVVTAPAEAAAAQRLLALGWRPGSRISVIRRSSGGARIVALSGARVAIGGPLARSLAVTAAV